MMLRTTTLHFFAVGASLLQGTQSFSVCPVFQSRLLQPSCDVRAFSSYLSFSSETERDDKEGNVELNIESLSSEQKKEAVGNLVADDEWQGVTMELTELVRIAILEDVKKNTRDFIGKDDYKVGDLSKEIDVRVKDEVAKFRGKEAYELGDFVLAMDEMSKSFTEDLTGKEYEPGDLSKELDRRIKDKVAEWSGKDEYEFGDLTRTVTERVNKRVEDFTGKPYEFGDVSRTIEDRRRAWVKDFLGEEAAENYQFGDVTKKALSSFVGKEYQFGDVSKKLMNDLFGKRKKKSSD